jgi:hypothetical protein
MPVLQLTHYHTADTLLESAQGMRSIGPAHVTMAPTQILSHRTSTCPRRTWTSRTVLAAVQLSKKSHSRLKSFLLTSNLSCYLQYVLLAQRSVLWLTLISGRQRRQPSGNSQFLRVQFLRRIVPPRLRGCPPRRDGHDHEWRLCIECRWSPRCRNVEARR